MTALTLIDEAPVRVVIRRRADEGSTGDAGRTEAYLAFQRNVTEAASRHPGFLAREVLQPSADQPDWIVQLRFANLETARAWLASPERAALYAESPDGFGNEGEPRIYREEPDEPDSAVSAVISSTVAPGDEDAFLAWQARISDAETRFRGFRGHRVQRPVEGVQKEWVIVLTFDTERDLEAWTGSAERAALLADGARFNADLELRKARFGFGFWRLDRETHEIPVIKNNLLVLLVLYPTVYLWGFFVSAPLLENHDVPFWLTLFVGNLVSTQLLGWVLVPWIFQRFRWWLAASPGWKANLLGFGLLVVLYGASMAVYAWLLTWP